VGLVGLVGFGFTYPTHLTHPTYLTYCCCVAFAGSSTTVDQNPIIISSQV
jgi:hypothetical protein